MNRPHTGMHARPAYVTIYSLISSLPLFRFSTWTLKGTDGRKPERGVLWPHLQMSSEAKLEKTPQAKQGIHTHLQAASWFSLTKQPLLKAISSMLCVSHQTWAWRHSSQRRKPNYVAPTCKEQVYLLPAIAISLVMAALLPAKYPLTVILFGGTPCQQRSLHFTAAWCHHFTSQ